MKNEPVYGIMQEMVTAVEEGNTVRYMATTREQKHVLDGCEAGRYVRRALDEYLMHISDGIPDRFLRIKAAVHNMHNSRNLFDSRGRPKRHLAPLPR